MPRNHHPSSSPAGGLARSAKMRLAAAAGIASLALLLSACAVTGGDAANPSTAAGECGTVPTVAPVADPDNLVSTLPAEVQAAFNGFPSPIAGSAWADTAPRGEKPFTVGLSFLPVQNTWASETLKELNRLFDEAKAAGIVKGELLVQMPADPTTMTAAEQIAGYQKLVADGADLILMYPLDGDAMVAPVEEAGKQGIPTITLVGNVPSPYAVNVGNNPYTRVASPVAEAMNILGGKGNLIIVSGIEGISITTISVEAAKNALATCPDINIVGTVNGDYSNSVTKSALVTFLASHPEQIDAVLQIGTMGGGVWSAFESVGRPAPLVIDVGASAGSLAYWKQATADGYEGAGLPETAIQVIDCVWNVGLRVMDGQGPIVNQIPVVPTVLTNDNLDDYLVPGADVNSSDDTLTPGDWIPKNLLDQMFKNPA